MTKRIEFTLEKKINSPKNWNGSGQVKSDLKNNYAFVKRNEPHPSNLWNLTTGDIVSGSWIGLHPKGFGLRPATIDGAEKIELCTIENGGMVTRFEKLHGFTFSPFDEFGTPVKLSTDSEDLPPFKKGYTFPAQIYNLQTGECVSTIPLSMLNNFLPNGRIVTCGTLGELSVYDLASGNCLQTLKGVGRTPLLSLLDKTGERLLVYGINSKTGEVLYKVWDTNSFTLLFENKLANVRPGKHATFNDGRYLVGDLAVIDTERVTVNTLWLGKHTEAYAQALIPMKWPYFATVICRDTLGLVDHLEMWNLESLLRIGSIEVERHAHFLIATNNDQIAVLHFIGSGRPTYDDAEFPSLTIYNFVSVDSNEELLQPERVILQ